MKLLVGLGNPGSKYRQTRHNVGYEVVAQVARQLGGTEFRRRFSGELGQVRLDEQSLLLLCPTTYMNRSGVSVRAAVDFYRLPLEDLLVVCDDFHLPLGSLRIRPHGSSGGQKGLADIIQHLQTEEVARLRLGIGPVSARMDAADFVLQRFTEQQIEPARQMIQLAGQAALDWVRHGTHYCMNHYNRRSQIREEEES